MASGLQQDGISNRDILSDGTVVYFDSAGNSYTRLGFRSLEKATKVLCGVVTSSSALLKRLFPDNSIIHLLLDVATVLCAYAVSTFKELADGALIEEVSEQYQNVLADLQAIVDKHNAI